MFKRINNWHLSVLVAIVSIFSLALIQQYAAAQWVDPGGLPGSSVVKSIVFNPMEDDLDLAGHNIISSNVDIYADGDGSVYGTTTVALDIDGNKSICLNGGCIRGWAEGSIGGGGDADYIPIFTSTNTLGKSLMKQSSGKVTVGNSSNGAGMEIINQGGGWNLLKLNAFSGVGKEVLFINNLGAGHSVLVNDAVSDSTPFVIDNVGRVGIGIATPNPSASHGLLHIRTQNSSNAELDIQSGSAAGSHWGIYQDYGTKDLRFWNINNNVTFPFAGGLIVDSSNVFLLATTTTSLPTEATGAGTRMLWYPQKGAIRIGKVDGLQFDDVNINTGSTISGGENNIANWYYTTISGGLNNQAIASYSTVGGGESNVASGSHSFVGSGLTNTALSNNSAIVGGGNNNSEGVYGFIGGGQYNLTREEYSLVVGGYSNEATGIRSTLVGGYNNGVAASYGFIGGGFSNIISSTGSYGFIGGGYSNTVDGYKATILGGENNKAAGDYSFAGGRNMQLSAAADNTFVWGNSALAFPITQPDSFLIFPSLSTGKVGIGMANPSSRLHVSGDISVVSNSFDGINNYIQLDTIDDGSTPSSTDCDNISELGRMIYETNASGGGTLYICDKTLTGYEWDQH